MRIGDDDSFSGGDYSNGDVYELCDPADGQNDKNKTNDEDKTNDKTSQMNFSQALDTLQQQQRQHRDRLRPIQVEESGQQQHSVHSNVDTHANVDWDEYMNDSEHPEDEEWEIERRMRLLQEEEDEEERQRRSGIRLTAPPSEVRRRSKQPKHTQQSNRVDITAQLRAKQMELVDVQVNVQKLLFENATIAQKEATERLAMTVALRKCAEIDLASKTREFDENNV